MNSTLAETSELVGRTRELARIAEHVARGEARVVLAGLTGMGKTALLRAALSAEPRARVVSMAGARSIEDVHVAIADALGARLGATTTVAVRRGALLRALRRRGVDVLGFDAADDAIAVLDDEVEAMRDEGGLRVALVTVRAIPAWPSATLIEVGPLSTSAQGGAASVAASLFASIVRRTRSDYDVASELAVIERVVASVDGVPAAIAILAGRRRFLAASDLEAIAVRAASEPLGGAIASIRDAIEALPPETRRVMEAGAWFERPFGADDVAAMLGTSPAEVAPHFERLHDSCLISLESASNGDPRARLLGVVRGLVRDTSVSASVAVAGGLAGGGGGGGSGGEEGRGTGAGAAASLRDAFVARVVTSVRELVARVDRGRAEALAMLEERRFDLDVVLREAQGADVVSSEDALLVAAALEVLAARRVIAATSLERARAVMEERFARGDASPAGVAFALSARALGAALRGETAASVADATRACELAEADAAGDAEGRARAHWTRSFAAIRGGDYATAAQHLAIVRADTSAAVAAWRARALLGESNLAHFERRADAAFELGLAAHRLANACDDRATAALAAIQLARLYAVAGDVDAADAVLAPVEALAAGELELRTVLWRAFARGTVEHARGDLARAADAYGAALETARDLGDRWSEGLLLGMGALARAALGMRADTEAQLAAARDAVVSHARLAAVFGAARAALLGAAGRHVEAEVDLREALAAVRAGPVDDLSDAADVAEAIAELAVARMHQAAGRHAEAERQVAVARARAGPKLTSRHAEEELRALRHVWSAEIARWTHDGGAASVALPPLGIDRRGRFFRFEDGEASKVPLRGPAQRVVLALAKLHDERPGDTASVADLLEVGWPGERILPEAGRMRLHQTIARLRKAGLGAALENADGGYRIVAAVHVAWMD